MLAEEFNLANQDSKQGYVNSVSSHSVPNVRRHLNSLGVVVQLGCRRWVSYHVYVSCD